MNIIRSPNRCDTNIVHAGSHPNLSIVTGTIFRIKRKNTDQEEINQQLTHIQKQMSAIMELLTSFVNISNKKYHEDYQ